MATTLEYIEFVMDSVGRIPNIEFYYKKMFGEYCIYADGKLILLVCDNNVYVKMLPCIQNLMADARTQPPYPSAKPHYLLDIDNSDLTADVIHRLLL